MILLDANILIHSRQPVSPHYHTITQKLIEFIENNEDLVICPQVLYEYYVVVTRPAAQNGYNISCDVAMQQINDFINTYPFINDPATLFVEWQLIIKNYQTIGKTAHDARLVALMRVQAIGTIYTMNPGDFFRYNDIITVLN